MSANETTVAPGTAASVDAEKQFAFLVKDGALLFSIALACRVGRRALQWRLAEDDPRKELLLKTLDVSFWSCMWFAFSVSLVVYNKWLMHSWQGGFDFPLVISMLHMMLKYVLSMCLVRCNRSFVVPDIPRKVWWLSAVPVGMATALDVAASNASYLYITVSFYTIVKSSSLIFTLFFSILYKLQPCSSPLIGSVLVIGAGVALASFGDTEFNLIGFGLVLGASAVGGFRWSLTQVLMRQIKSKLDAILTIYLISPASALTLVPLCLWLEGARFFSSKFLEPDLILYTFANILGAGLFAFAMILVELELLRRTSSMTLGVISYVKQILQITFSVLIFQDRLTTLNILGFLLTIVGMFLYTYTQQGADTRKTYVETRAQDGLFEFEIGDDDASELELHDLSDRANGIGTAHGYRNGNGSGGGSANGNGHGNRNGNGNGNGNGEGKGRTASSTSLEGSGALLRRGSSDVDIDGRSSGYQSVDLT